MPKVYLDWNIYSYLAKGENDELYNILNQSNLILIYSIYHLSDVRKSIVKYGGINEYTRNELKTLSHLTNNRCLFREATGLVQSGIINPEEYLDSLEIQDNLINNFNLDAIFDALDAPEYQDIFDKIKQELRRIELPDILLDYNLFEGNKSNSLDDFLKFSADSYIDLTTTDSFKGMRSGFQKTGISHKSFHSNQNPLKVLAKIFEERGYGDMGETMFAFKMEKDEWFDQIVSLYLTLDFCGYRSDSINVNNRKSQTF
ncbi:hypothetical protein [Leeuwenhoekiella parthenopeia]|uniref:DUF4935 domain-containing protein n=1 Tax=Leeuwenhoekiella parthenopeia TaxID=2890320 RepID=A0ABS8GN29_9FLAO|nr:hypothetical protein [Leeuwenhoekiella parthenopeia]MCC4211392.1 hypothetical protein [Leeuwenhoekiella parthenopeia]